MNVILDKLLSQVYELEGLLLVIERHKHETSPFIYEMIQRKVERINELAADCTPDIFPQPVKEEFTQPMMTFGQDESIDDDFEDEEETIEEEVLAMEEEPVEEIANNDIQEEQAEEDEEVEETTYVEYDETADAEEEYNYADTIEEHYSDEIVDEEPTPEYEEFTPAESEIEDELNTRLTIMEDIVEDDEVGTFDNEEYIENGEDEEPIKLDEYLQRSLSKDLSKAFSLNDRFRYRRELFGNSEVEMCNTINMVEAMKSYSEAEDYFYGDLEWDKESPEVTDFMSVIKKHFL